MLCTKRHLLKLGLHETLQKLRLKKNGRTRQRSQLSHVNEARNIASDLYELSVYLPLKFKCLEFSIALSFLLIRYGCSFKFKIGVQRYDFLSHAWIEIDGEVLCDIPELASQMPVIMEI